MQHDFDIAGSGSIYILTPQTDAAREWCAEHIPDATPWAGGFAVEHGYIHDVTVGILNDGFSVSKDDRTVQEKDGELILVEPAPVFVLGEVFTPEGYEPTPG